MTLRVTQFLRLRSSSYVRTFSSAVCCLDLQPVSFANSVKPSCSLKKTGKAIISGVSIGRRKMPNVVEENIPRI